MLLKYKLRVRGRCHYRSGGSGVEARLVCIRGWGEKSSKSVVL